MTAAQTETYNSSFDVDEYIQKNFHSLENMISGIAHNLRISDPSRMSYEDYVQEGWLILWSKRYHYNPKEGSFANWAAVVVCNAMRTLGRKEFRRTINDTKFIEKMKAKQEYRCSQSRTDYTVYMTHSDLLNAIHTLRKTEKSFTVQLGLTGIWNTYTGQYSSDEMAALYQVSIQHYNAAISRARKKLSPLLTAYYE